jgi:hypothetical protein
MRHTQQELIAAAAAWEADEAEASSNTAAATGVDTATVSAAALRLVG